MERRHIGGFIRIGSVAIFVTRMHFKFELLHFDCEMTVAEDWSLKYTYKLKLGASPVQDYGIDFASRTMLPKSIIEKAREIADRIKFLRKESQYVEVDPELPINRKIYSFMAKAYNLLETNRFTSSNLLVLLEKSVDEKLITSLIRDGLAEVLRLEDESVPPKTFMEKSLRIVNPNQSLMLSMLSVSNILCSNFQSLKDSIGQKSDTGESPRREPSTCLVAGDTNQGYIPMLSESNILKSQEKESSNYDNIAMDFVSNSVKDIGNCENKEGDNQDDPGISLNLEDDNDENVAMDFASNSLKDVEDCKNADENDQDGPEISLLPPLQSPSPEDPNANVNSVKISENEVISTPQGSEKFDVHTFYEELLQKTLLLEINESQD
ncbi:hypothetical protein QAD02_022179 [Eretmocerus hayati]|uniref:Uncharacterized protein n=1 Tax=Eretmocerus hayati TaxID=131215 RepID=A0ACC2PX53_9HYME|nr:hypothetical protein QAD02_022179 [Eretmocerus hayati]